MGLSGAPKPLLGLRIAQLVVVIPFMAMVAFANAHPAYWTNLKGPTALAEITGGLTFIACCLWIFGHIKGFCPDKPWKAIILDVIITIFWIASISQFFVHKNIDEGKKFAWQHKFGPDAPKSSWYAGAGLAITEVVWWIISSGLMWRQAKL